ncbi:MAG: FliI/YscN family ATPase [Candidatus Hydrogenedentota bacterium]|nr:MAG: FliI/YscN family ATPase [Candidatus Hydrogenedentota bacterium]
MINKKIVPPIGLLDKYKVILHNTEPVRSLGEVIEVTGSIVVSKGPDVSLGELCHIEKIENEAYILAEVVGFRENDVLLSPLESITGIYPGCRVLSTGSEPTIQLAPELLGRIVDGLGRPLDKKARVNSTEVRSFENKPPNPMQRPIIESPLVTGIRAIDGLLTIGKGQRIGIFSGSGVGKSTLLGMIARYSRADVNVIGLIGERGREVKEFIERELGEAGMKRSVLVVASSNESPMHRVRAAFLATTIAEYFRDLGKDVLLMMDSITRLAMAQREVGLAAGEPATTKGYPPSVFSMLPSLLERAGTSETGSITGIYTVLVEADDLNDPIGDATRGILDGHIVLSRKLASAGHYPSIDVPESISRSMPYIIEESHLQLAQQVKQLLAEYKENEEIIQLGAYVQGANPVLDLAVKLKPKLDAFLKQDIKEFSNFENTLSQLRNILQEDRPRTETIRRGVGVLR